MKHFLLTAILAIPGILAAQTTESRHIDMDNGVLGIADNRGFTLQSRDSSFVFKPYLFLQSQGSYHYYDDEGLDKAYNQDNVANSGFSMPSSASQEPPSGGSTTTCV